MSPELKAFFLFMQAWIDEGCQPNKFGIDIGSGLCRAVLRWASFKDNSPVHRFDVKRELTALFNEHLYPFNEDSADFVQEEFAGTMYKNPRRLAFIKEHSSEVSSV